MTNFSIRLAQPSDLVEIVRIVNAAYDRWIAVIGRKPRPMLADYPALIEQGSVWMGEQDGSSIAVLVIWAHEDALYIDNIAVQPEYQRQGIAERLIGFAGMQARNRHLPALRLMTNAKMLSNQAYYRKHGFTETRRETTDDGRHAVWMEKPLAAPL